MPRIFLFSQCLVLCFLLLTSGSGFRSKEAIAQQLNNQIDSQENNQTGNQLNNSASVTGMTKVTSVTSVNTEPSQNIAYLENVENLENLENINGNQCPDLYAIAINQAGTAYANSLRASTAADWDQVALGWFQAVTSLQSLPLNHPQKAFAQKKVLEYMENLSVALTRSRDMATPVPFNSFNSRLLDEQLRLYLSYVAAVGVPDVLIVGSSRSLQAINPRELRFALAGAGLDGLRVFNFSVNGATAQVVNLQLTQLLSPQQLPKMIIWADGSRAFNSGNPDRTFQSIQLSGGYQRAIAGDRPSLPPAPACGGQKSTSKFPDQASGQFLGENDWLSKILAPPAVARPGVIPVNIDAYGFNYVEGNFDPRTYFQQVPRVTGQFDADYQNFNLGGVQAAALNNVINFTRTQNIRLVFIHLPLTGTYLDPVRRNFEQQFQVFMQRQANQNNFTFIDFSQALVNRNDLFIDPSHLNYQGAALISRQLAGDRRIPWATLRQ